MGKLNKLLRPIALKQANYLRCSIICFFSMLSFIASAQADTIEFNSGKARVQLVELYTSEGCSSCPPADRWLSNLVDHKDLWKKVVPIAFHVDYWDYIGWKDPFAHPKHTQRQYQFKQQGLSSSVYTPEVVRNGYELRHWYQGSPLSNKASEEIGNLSVVIKDDYATINFGVEKNLNIPLEVNVSLLGKNLVTQVKAGENRGRTLKHNFVALDWQKQVASPVDNNYKWSLPITNTSKFPAKAIAVWVNTLNDVRPIQSTGGWLK